MERRLPLALVAALAVVLGCPVPGLAQSPEPAALRADPASFSTTVLSGDHVDLSVVVYKDGPGEVRIVDATLEGHQPQAFRNHCTGWVVTAESFCHIGVLLDYEVPGRYEGAIVVTPETGAVLRVPVVVEVLGNVGLRYSTPAIDFGDVVVGTTSAPRTVTVTNVYTQLWTGDIWDPAQPEFVPDYWPPCTNNYTLLPGWSCVLTYRFRPTRVGTVEGRIRLDTFDSRTEPAPIAVRGRGVAPPAPAAPATAEPAPPAVVLDTVVTAEPGRPTLPRTGRGDVAVHALVGVATVLAGTALRSAAR